MRIVNVLTALLASIVPPGPPWSSEAALSQIPLVLDNNTTLSTFATQTDAGWYLNRISQRGAIIDWPANPAPDKQQEKLDFTWDYDPNWGRGILVYVLDSGIQPTHSDLDGRVDPKGMVVTRLKGGPKGDPFVDEEDHGTGVASLIAGRQFGVAKAATLISVKVGAGEGEKDFTLEDITKGIELATADFVERKAKDRELRAVMNISWIIRHDPARKGEIAIEKAIAQGIHVVYAAGNEGSDKCVDLVAPATSIACASSKGPFEKRFGPGTSYAAPLVAGTVAAILSTDGKDLTPAQMKARILNEFTIPGVTYIPPGSPDRMLVITNLPRRD
ncbi:peptidase S8/S53 domain-containing protein [Rhodocollybia butyracea]|uniref:Peptidase S8/S53 domain-containing protein n=1 Tax=Rhodocollybia butyracea TaxID=206335 RepID=A0A9P5PAB9_9AGAR|nr:peptidase S8/S53 domain-containing protein [Rhodocollybia butyracea]